MERRTPREEAAEARARAAEARAAGADVAAEDARAAMAEERGGNRLAWIGGGAILLGAGIVGGIILDRSCNNPTAVGPATGPSRTPEAAGTARAAAPSATVVARAATALPKAEDVIAKFEATANAQNTRIAGLEQKTPEPAKAANTATATATAKPEATATPIVKIEQHKYVDVELKARESATLPAEFFTDGKVTVNKGDSVVIFKDGVKTIRRVVTYDNNANTGQMTLITSDGSVDVYSEWGSNITSQIEPINLVPFVEHNVDLMKQLGCEGEKRGGCKTVMIMILECKNGQVKEIRVNNMDQIKAFAESRAH